VVVTREISFDEMGKQLLIIVSLLAIMIILSAIAAIYSQSPSLIANFATTLFVSSTVLNALLGYFLGRRKVERISLISIFINSVLCIIGAYLIFENVVLIYNNIKTKPTVTHFEVALTVPILLIIITYIASELTEKRIPEKYWRTARILGDRVRGIISSAGLAIIGPTGAFFGVRIMDPFFAIFVVLYAVIECWRTIGEIRFVRKKNNLLQTLEKVAEETFKAIPAIHSVETEYMDVAGHFIVIHLQATVSKILEEEYIESIADFMLTELIDRLGTVIYLRILIGTKEPKKVIIAVPVMDSETVASFPSEKTAIITLEYPSGRVLNKEIIDLKFDEYEKIPEAKAVEKLAKKNVLIIGAKSINEIAERVARHWFIEVIKLDKEKIEEVIETIKQNLAQ